MPPQLPQKSGAAKIALIVTVVLAGVAIGFLGISLVVKHFKGGKAGAEFQASKATGAETLQALGVLNKVRAAYAGLNSASANGSFALQLDISKLTMADVNPGLAADSKVADRHPPGMPSNLAVTMDFSVKRAHTNWIYFTGETVSKMDRHTTTNTFAFWSSDKGRFMFVDPHLRGNHASYERLPDEDPANAVAAQFKSMLSLFDDPAQVTKIIKDLRPAGDETVNGQNCYTFTAKVLGQPVKMWVDKASYLIPQWQLTLGGRISDADVDDVYSLIATSFTNVPAMQLAMIEPMVKKMTPSVAKIHGSITVTSKNVEVNPELSADDFDYPVPAGVKLIRN